MSLYVRHKTEKDQKRKAETDLYTKQIEIKAIQLQATMLEQKCLLTWGPVALEVQLGCWHGVFVFCTQRPVECFVCNVAFNLQTGRLDKEAIIHIRDGIRTLNVSTFSHYARLQDSQKIMPGSCDIA